MPSASQAVEGRLTGSDITLPDGSTLIADQTYGILVPYGTSSAKIDVGSGSTINVFSDANTTARVIQLLGPGGSLTANQLSIETSGYSGMDI